MAEPLVAHVLTAADMSAPKEPEERDPLKIRANQTEAEIAAIEHALSEPQRQAERLEALREQRAALDAEMAQRLLDTTADAAAEDLEMRANIARAEAALDPFIEAATTALDYWRTYTDAWRRCADAGGDVPMRIRASEAFPHVLKLRRLLDRYERIQ